jgi:dUTP pyrophosphatase
MVIPRIPIKVKRLHPDAQIPTYGNNNAAGFDLYAVEDEVIEPGDTKIIRSGIAMEIPEGKAVFLWDRSGMGVKAVHRLAGLIDSDYRGEYKIVLCNHGKKPLFIKAGDRIAQGVIQDYYKAEFEETYELADSERGDGWNHSTGR